jgi:hypothetical protein
VVILVLSLMAIVGTRYRCFGGLSS